MCPVHGECEEVRGTADAGIVAADEVFTALCGQGIVEMEYRGEQDAEVFLDLRLVL